MDNEESQTAAESKMTLVPKTASELTAVPTVGQLEREISQKMQALYKKTLGHRTGRATCQLLDAKVAIVLEASVAKPVQLLVEAEQDELVQQIRDDLNNAMQPLIEALLSEILRVEVLDVLSDTSLTTGRTGVVGVLASSPAVRNAEAVSSAKR